MRAGIIKQAVRSSGVGISSAKQLPYILINTPSQVLRGTNPSKNTMGKQVKPKQTRSKPTRIQAKKVNNDQVRKLLIPDKRAIAKQKKKMKSMHKQKLSLVLKQDLMNCPICLETMINPAVTICGHSFCLTCIEEYFFRSTLQFFNEDDPSCPSCRNPLQCYACHQSTKLTAIINYYINNFAKEEEITQYQQRRQALEEQQKKRNVNKIEQGIMVDYFNNQSSTWQQGEIFEKYKNKQGQMVVILKIAAEQGCILPHRHYEIKEGSRMIAKHGYFTKRYDEVRSISEEEETVDNRENVQDEDEDNEDEVQNEVQSNPQQPVDEDQQEQQSGIFGHFRPVQVQIKRQAEYDSQQEDDSSQSIQSIEK